VLAVVGSEVLFLRGHGVGNPGTHKESTTQRLLATKTTMRGLPTLVGILDKYCI